MFKGKSSIEKEWKKLQKQEIDFLVKNIKREDSALNQLLEEKVPEGLQSTLDKAFFKAFQLVFEKGTGIIEKTYNKEKIEIDYQLGEIKADMSKDRKELKAFSSKAKTSGAVNTLVSGASGVGLGVLGIGVPDILLFTGVMLKNVYQIALNFGFDYDSEEEKKFILLLIQGALSSGDDLREINSKIDMYIDKGEFITGDGKNAEDVQDDMKKRIKDASECLSKELLYMKFLQGIPFVGAVGGAYNAIYMRRISKYAELKYRRRFYLGKINADND
ncbi:MAG: EcsC family protein [Bacillota bacterium]|nr:EcsC family protein [Bacillota bacterium]